MCVLRRYLLCRHSVGYATESAIHCVDDVSRVVSGVSVNRASVGRHAVANVGKSALHRSAVFTATLLELCRKSRLSALHSVKALHHSDVICVKSLLCLIAEVANRVVDAVESVEDGRVKSVKSVAKSLLYAADGILQAVESKLALEVCAC